MKFSTPISLYLANTFFRVGMAQKMSRWKGLPKGTIRGYSCELVDLIGRMLDPDHRRRPSAAEIETECTEDKRDEQNFLSFTSMDM